MAAKAPRKIEKITLGEMRASGVRGLLIYCADYRCSHSIAISRLATTSTKVFRA